MWYATIEGTRQVVQPIRKLPNAHAHSLVVVHAYHGDYVVFEPDNPSQSPTDATSPPAHKWRGARRRRFVELEDARKHVQTPSSESTWRRYKAALVPRSCLTR